MIGWLLLAEPDKKPVNKTHFYPTNCSPLRRRRPLSLLRAHDGIALTAKTVQDSQVSYLAFQTLHVENIKHIRKRAAIRSQPQPIHQSNMQIPCNGTCFERDATYILNNLVCRYDFSTYNANVFSKRFNAAAW